MKQYSICLNMYLQRIIMEESKTQEGIVDLEEPKKMTREDWRKKKELEEQRKLGNAPAEVDEEGKYVETINTTHVHIILTYHFVRTSSLLSFLFPGISTLIFPSTSHPSLGTSTPQRDPPLSTRDLRLNKRKSFHQLGNGTREVYKK